LTDPDNFENLSALGLLAARFGSVATTWPAKGELLSEVVRLLLPGNKASEAEGIS
jgi:hypothetical protein